MLPLNCLLYTSDAVDEEDSVDLGGRRIIKKKSTRSDKPLFYKPRRSKVLAAKSQKTKSTLTNTLLTRKNKTKSHPSF